jgi:hypothetical protein
MMLGLGGGAVVGASATIFGAPGCARIVGFDRVSYVDGSENAAFPGERGTLDLEVNDTGSDAPCGAGENIGTVGDGGSKVHVGVYEGRGRVIVFRNGQLVGSTSGNGLFMFNLGDTFAFAAMPCPGFSFVQFCGDVPHCNLTTDAAEFGGTITAEEGIVYALFQP